MRVKEKVYKKILAAKKTIVEEEWIKYWLEYPERGQELVENAMIAKIPQLDRLALLTVLQCGTFREDGGFNMPSTACCCKNYNEVKKSYKRRIASIYVYDNIEDRYYTLPCRPKKRHESD